MAVGMSSVTLVSVCATSPTLCQIRLTQYLLLQLLARLLLVSKKGGYFEARGVSVVGRHGGRHDEKC
jgi:hypothetical protein